MPSASEILYEVVKTETQKRNAPISGAALKFVLQKREDIDLPSGKFIDFLEDHLDKISIIQRTGSDILIAPKDNAQLVERSLSTFSHTSKKVRKDFYRAFTIISPDQKRSYDMENDSIKWTPINDEISSQYIPIPDRTEAMEVDVRKKFVFGLPDTETKNNLLKCFEKSLILTAFSNEIRRVGLVDEWFEFRTSTVIEAISAWANEWRIAIRESWFSGTMHETRMEPTSNHETAPELFASSAIIDKLKCLNIDELSRINVPLDIVMKLLAK